MTLAHFLLQLSTSTAKFLWAAQTGNSGTFGNHLESRTFWNLLELSGTFWNLLKPSETFWNSLELSGTFWNLLEPSGTFWNLLEPSGTVWNLLETFWTIWNLLEPFGTLVLSHWSSIFNLIIDRQTKLSLWQTLHYIVSLLWVTITQKALLELCLRS